MCLKENLLTVKIHGNDFYYKQEMEGFIIFPVLPFIEHGFSDCKKAEDETSSMFRIGNPHNYKHVAHGVFYVAKKPKMMRSTY
jgi:hypothetical protein